MPLIGLHIGCISNLNHNDAITNMSHDHHHGNGNKNLRTAFFLNLAFTIFEFIGGFFVNSVAIISDAVHDLGDSLSLGTSWYLQHKSQQEADQTFSFGYERFSLLGALINSVVLIAGSIYVIYEAVERLQAPESPNAQGMLVFALVGVAVNGFAAWKLSHGSSMNERVVSWHLLEDVLGWVAVLIVSIILQFRDIPWLDPALSLFITAYILWNVVRRLKETLFIFLQGAPKDISLEGLRQELLQVDKVASLHHTHVWSLDGEHHVFTTHVKLAHIDTFEQLLQVKDAIKQKLARYSFTHCTVETELEEETCALARHT